MAYYYERMDRVLGVLADKKDGYYFTPEQLAKEIPEMEKFEVAVILEFLAKRDYANEQIERVDGMGFMPNQNLIIYRITIQGILFLEEGGFFEEIKGQKAQKQLIRANTNMARLNAILILILTGLNVYVAWISNSDKEEAKLQKVIIAKQTHAIDSLINKKK